MGAITPTITSGFGLASGLLGALNTVDQLVSGFQDFGRDPEAERRAAEEQRRRQLIAEQDQALAQLQERQATQQNQQAQNTALEKERLAVQAQQENDKRRAALRRAVARQKAQFGSSGVGSGAGSSQAVLLGLFDETEDELQKREQLDNLRTRALDMEGTQARSLNVLQATQLAERNRLSRLF